MDFNKFKTFLLVVKKGGITEASKVLYRSQQAISQQIISLEDELKLKLFNRLGPKISLSKDGKALYQQLSPYFVSIENVLQSYNSSKNSLTGTIRIGAWLEQAVNYIPDILQSFKQEFPNAGFNIEIATDADLKKQLANNIIDFAFLLEPGNDTTIESVQVFKRNLILVASKNYLTRHKNKLNIEDTLSFDLLDYPPEYSAYNAWIKKNAQLYLNSAKMKTPVVTAPNDIVLKELVLRDMGMAVIPQESIQQEIDSKTIIALFPHSSVPLTVIIELAYKKRQVMSKLEEEFYQFVTNNTYGV